MLGLQAERVHRAERSAPAGDCANGKQWALSGDINVCGCNPPPVFYAERGMSMTFTSEQVAVLMGNGVPASSSAAASSVSAYDEQVRAVLVRASLVGYPYLIETSAGAVHSGRIDSRGLLPRVFTNEVDTYTVDWGDEALSLEGWK